MTRAETAIPRLLLTSTRLVALLATLLVSIAAWAVRESTVTVDMGMNGAPLVPDLSTFQRLHWVWLILFVCPAVYIGIARIRAPVLCGAFTYGLGTLFGWCVAELGSVLSDPLLRPGLWVMLAQALSFGAILGALLVGVVRLCRYVLLQATRPR
jgi:hypothetical protein